MLSNGVSASSLTTRLSDRLPRGWSCTNSNVLSFSHKSGRAGETGKYILKRTREATIMTPMRSFHGWIAVLSLAALSACSPSTTGTSTAIPHLQKQGTATQLIVDGKPFLMLAGELRNSSSSSSEFLKPIWPRLVAMHLNTVLSAVQWELLEPQEGQFDFAFVDSQIQGAQAHNLRLVFLWFGSWKNGVSSYIPAWVKTNQDRFPRVQDKDGKGIETLSTLSTANRDADARAFAALMRHIKQVDTQHTVVM